MEDSLPSEELEPMEPVEDSDSDSFNDKNFLMAAELAIKEGKISTSLIQRKMGVGYGLAATLIDKLEAEGIISEPNGQKPRKVLINSEQWQNMLKNR